MEQSPTLIPDWVGAACHNGAYREPTTTAVAEAISWFGQNWKTPERINKILQECPLCQLHPAYLITMIRITYSLRNKLPEWPYLVERVRDELLNRGQTFEQVKLTLNNLVDDRLNVIE
jgi:hypothetical protein